MALDLFGAATLGGLDQGRGSGRTLVMMTGEVTGLQAGGINTDVLVNDAGNVAAAQTSITVDGGGGDATDFIKVGDRLFSTDAATGVILNEIGTVTSVTSTSVGISAGTAFALANNDQLFVAASYQVNADGTVSEEGSGHLTATGDLVMNYGAGQIEIYGSDFAQVAGTDEKINRGGVALTMEVIFGNDFSATDSINLIGAIASVGWDLGSGTVGSAVIDNVCFASVAGISGNKVTLLVGLPYENEGGTQLNIVDSSILKFCVMAVTDSNGV